MKILLAKTLGTPLALIKIELDKFTLKQQWRPKMFLVATVIIIPSVIALAVQFVCYQQYLAAKTPFAAEYAPA